MPYKNIQWIKLEKRLLNDYRFYTLSEEAQLIYLKFLMLAAETNNKIPKNNGVIKTALRTHLSENKIQECIEEIKKNFPKFKENKGFYFFREWANRCNWIGKRELPGNSQGVAGEAIEKKRIDKIRKEYIKKKKWEEKDLYPDDYARMGKAIKTLYLKAKGDVERVCQAIDWVSRQGYCDWTLETVIKKWQDFLKAEPKKSANLKRLEEMMSNVK